MSTKLRTLANEITQNLHYVDISDGTKRLVWKDTAPEDLQKWFSNISGNYTNFNFSSLDEAYDVLQSTAMIIEDNTSPDDVDELTMDKIMDIIQENQWSYDGNADLLQWVRDDLTRIDDVNEALENGAQGIMGAIQYAMDSTRSDMALHFATKMMEKEGLDA